MFRENEKGSALPLVMIVVFVLSLLGFALMNYSIADSMQVARDESKMKAHYLARSGAHAVAQYLVENPDMLYELLGKDSGEVTLGEGTFTVKVSGNPDTTVFVESTGEVGDVSQTVLVTLENDAVFGFALFGADIYLQGNVLIDGDIVYTTDYDDTGNVTVEGNITKSSMAYPEVPFPICCLDLTHITDDSLVHPGSEEIATIHQDSCTNKVVLKNKHDVLTIKLGDEEAEDRILLIDEFNSSGGTIVLEGKGRFLLFVKEKFVLNGNYTSTDAGESHTIVFVAPDAEFIQTGTTHFDGIIYAPHSTLETKGGGEGANIVGSVIAEDITGNGNVRVTYKAFSTKFLPLNVLGMGTWRYSFD